MALLGLRVLCLSGEVAAELELPPCTPLVEVLRRATAQDAPYARGRLVLDGEELAPDASLGSLGLALSPCITELQLIADSGRDFRPLADGEQFPDGGPGAQIRAMFRLVGSHQVGKTSMLNRFMDGTYVDHFIIPPGCVDFKIKRLLVDGSSQLKLLVWDSPHGKERRSMTTSSLYRGIDAVLVFFDLTDRDSFEAVPLWLAETRRHSKKDVVIVLVGNKADVVFRREVPEDEACAFAAAEHLQYFETSVKDNFGVEAPFFAALDLVLDQHAAQPPPRVPPVTRSTAHERRSTCSVA